jgi:hypothetical protein
MKRLLLIAVAVALGVGGCTLISRLPALQPPAVTKPSPAHASAAAASAPAVPAFWRGIDIDAYTYPGQNVAAAARADVAYIKGLNANAVSISFPFFITGDRAAGVYATSATPTPAQLAKVVRAAVRAGLRVTVRPLLAESSLRNPPYHCRCTWVPAHPGRWFTSYQDFLLPYAAAVQSAGAATLVVGTELDKFARAPQWKILDSAIRSVFHGQLACDSNWDAVNPFAGSCGLPASAQEVDAYPPMPGNVGYGWKLFDALLPKGTTESEVGIDAVAGAYSQPYRHHWPTQVLDEQVQAQWFTAACHAATARHLGGIYFWPVGLSTTTGAAPTPAFQGTWGGAGARAISQCFAQIERGGA